MIPRQKRSLKTLVPTSLGLPGFSTLVSHCPSLFFSPRHLFWLLLPRLSWSPFSVHHWSSFSISLVSLPCQSHSTRQLVCINSGAWICLASYHKSILFSSSCVCGKNYLFQLKLCSLCHEHLTSGWLGLPNSMYFWCCFSTLLNNVMSVYILAHSSP